MLSAGISGRQRGSPPSRPQGRFPLIITEAPDPPAVPGKVNINTADAAQLEALDGIGPTLAQRIVAYREEHGPFADIESIMDVNGIGEGIFETIRQQITVEDDT